MGRYTVIDKARADKRREFLLKQEKRVLAKRYSLEIQDTQFNLEKRKRLEQSYMDRVKDQLRRHVLAAESKKERLQRAEKVRS